MGWNTSKVNKKIAYKTTISTLDKEFPTISFCLLLNKSFPSSKKVGDANEQNIKKISILENDKKFDSRDLYLYVLKLCNGNKKEKFDIINNNFKNRMELKFTVMETKKQNKYLEKLILKHQIENDNVNALYIFNIEEEIELNKLKIRNLKLKGKDMK